MRSVLMLPLAKLVMTIEAVMRAVVTRPRVVIIATWLCLRTLAECEGDKADQRAES